MRQLYIFILLMGLSICAIAQNRAPSPASKTEQKVGLTDITVEYSRPGIKGRTVFQDGSPLAPLGKMWRTGANSATKVTFSDAVKIGGNDIGAGSYALTTIPGAESWTINFYPYSGTRWTEYMDAAPTVSVDVVPEQLGAVSIETFVINFDAIKDYSAVMVLGWGNTLVPINITVN